MNTPAAKPSAAQPFAGLRVLDCSAVLSGPLAAALLADQGAQVIKLETPEGDTTRRVGPAKGDSSAMFIASNRGKRCIALDLKQPAGREVAQRLARQADVLVENMRPGAMARLGLDWPTLHALNPRLVYLSITGFGPDGPDAGARAYDTVIQARSGLAASQPDPRTGEPTLMATTLCDKLTALTAAQALSAALYARERDGLGRHVEVAMLDAAVAFQWPDAMYNHVFLDEPPAPLPEFGAGQLPWRAKDGFFATSTPQPSEFAALCEVLGAPTLPQDQRFASTRGRMQNATELRALLAPLAAEQTLADLLPRLATAGVPAGRVHKRDEVADDPQLRHNALLQDQALLDLGRVRLPRAAARFDGEMARAPATAPQKGAHTREVLVELGYGTEEIEALLRSGAALATPAFIQLRS